MKKPGIVERIERALENRRSEGLFRTTPPSVAAPLSIDLATNSYLSLHEAPEVLEPARDLAGADLSGNLASRLVCTRSPLYEQLERELAAWKNTETALLFNSGYAANTGILQALCNRDTEVFSDRFNHASIVDGIRLSGARMVRFGHCDTRDLARRLGSSKAREKLIVTDTVFSMDGDRAPLEAICDLADEHGCMVMVDEAHGTGILGRGLSGLVEECGLEGRVAVRMGTLSKAAGGLGGFFAGSAVLRDHLVNHARSLVYSTALPHSVLAYDLAAVRHIRAHPELGPGVLARATSLRTALTRAGFDTLASTTQIVPCILGEPEKAFALSRFLHEHGIAAPAIRPPTVPAGTARLRLSVHSAFTDENQNTVTELIAGWKISHG